MNTTDPPPAQAAASDDRQLGRVADASRGGPTISEELRQASEELRQTASLALAKALRNYRKSAAPALTLRPSATLLGGFGRFFSRRPDGRPVAQEAEDLSRNALRSTPGSAVQQISRQRTDHLQ
ncbi:hypothetical protein [Sinomonas susongensis]|uniref:hypothetical protein n=1 Tax=Sinomonas susongensis TaxID=1324851 RepID=UPI001108F9B1|nr:hypothetical protein [Sinomonas susongensis]